MNCEFMIASTASAPGMPLPKAMLRLSASNIYILLPKEDAAHE